MALGPQRFALGDGRPATLLLRDGSSVLSVEDRDVSSWDLAGRPFALVRDSGTYRRGLDGGVLRKREATGDGPRVRERLTADEAAPVVEQARLDAVAALAALGPGPLPGTPDPAEAQARLRLVAGMTPGALAEDATRFLAASGPVGILPPDQYLALAVRLTEGCSWDACTFCSLYRGVPFRARDTEALQRHIDALRAYFGPSIALRRSVFLGDANALCLGQDRLRPLLETVAAAFPGTPLYSFVDAWTGQRKSVEDWRECRALGLRRVYVGLETGDPGLLAWLGKPGAPADAVSLVTALHEAGLAAGLIVLVGAGGERFSRAHVQHTTRVLEAMQLNRDDLVYFSEYVEDPSLGYGRLPSGDPALAPLVGEAARLQRGAISGGLHRVPGLRLATYDLREFVY